MERIFEDFSSLLGQFLKKQKALNQADLNQTSQQASSPFLLTEEWLRYALYSTVQNHLALTPADFLFKVPFNRLPCRFHFRNCSIDCYVVNPRRSGYDIHSVEQSQQTEQLEHSKDVDQIDAHVTEEGERSDFFACEVKFLRSQDEDEIARGITKRIENYEAKQVGSLLDVINKLSYLETKPATRRFMVYVTDSAFDEYMSDNISKFYGLKVGELIWLDYFLVERQNQGKIFMRYATKTLNDWMTCDVKCVYSQDFLSEGTTEGGETGFHLRILEVLSHKFRNS